MANTRGPFMDVVKTIDAAREALSKARGGSRKVGLVPTMGALHPGHLSLIKRAREECKVTVVSVFVNPAQFGVDEDLDTYPRDTAKDAELCKAEGANILFMPEPAEMYPSGYATYVLQERYTDPFEGELRTGHFHGVCTICCKLFNIVRPDVAYFGQKDYQQTVVVRRMAADLNIPVEIRVSPIVRESDGLAMSSRNSYLSPTEREQATVLYRALTAAKELFEEGERSGRALFAAMRAVFDKTPQARLDYAAVANPETLRELARVESKAVLLVACRIGRTHLIDNMLLTVP